MCWWIIERHEYVLTCCEVRKGIDIGTLTPCEAAKANGKHCTETVVEDRGRTFLQIDHCELCESEQTTSATGDMAIDPTLMTCTDWHQDQSLQSQFLPLPDILPLDPDSQASILPLQTAPQVEILPPNSSSTCKAGQKRRLRSLVPRPRTIRPPANGRSVGWATGNGYFQSWKPDAPSKETLPSAASVQDAFSDDTFLNEL